MYLIRNLTAISIVSLLSGCIMGSPYGGVIFVGPIDLIRATLDAKEERNKTSQNTQSKPVIYYKNEPRTVTVADITLNQEDIFYSKNNIGSINFTFPDEDEYKIILGLNYQNEKYQKLESKINLLMNNRENKLPLIDYGKRDIRYPDYKLSYISLYIFSEKNTFKLNITLTNSQSEKELSKNEDVIIKNEHSILKSKITIDDKDYKIDKVTYY
ncbi:MULTISPECIES: hypothetical protein [Enterobacterales]|uniref:hypothetical protein n=1 Tax=Enterobacterales TaxID=91347 RepID=UPI000847E926|nr:MULTISPECIES: hypothetical protein [Enterobacterales]WOO48980.1 hypothetical protein R2S03_16100 [Hafnia alvei]MCT6518988.1 hypothetical protein [Proteus vulgaris]ODQ06463.1 hypothetical protein BGK50_17965 [Shigella sp. FC130]OEI94000.1 hypothetical protein BHE86_16730 [Shigella sp. FC1655]WPF03446.1 hypothetical protein SB028_14935 [Proteus vulgaris]